MLTLEITWTYVPSAIIGSKHLRLYIAIYRVCNHLSEWWLHDHATEASWRLVRSSCQASTRQRIASNLPFVGVCTMCTFSFQGSLRNRLRSICNDVSHHKSRLEWFLDACWHKLTSIRCLKADVCWRPQTSRPRVGARPDSIMGLRNTFQIVCNRITTFYVIGRSATWSESIRLWGFDEIQLGGKII